ncbi:uncharacterized protein LOC117331673 isoform X2 [Pecten maximus]|uniref:uncharacterized protein LOC117331673 isoform X2 n=1 Tax=Pecten maximus TaxID=6579 RepID=UPI001458B164|nr:uncharacterized protein LOC117331673 isoform X2 [Pecten maximus]
MDFSALSSELQNIAGRYNGRDTDPAYSTTMYCEMFHKILQKTETEVHDYADQIVILWMTLSQLCNTANTLAPCPARHELYQDIFLQCAKTVLNIKWQNLAEDDQSKENFIETVKATHVQLVTTGFDRFSLLLHLMENPWTDPTLSEIMSGEADNDDDAVQEYVRKESSLILKLRVEMLMQENCEEFALNLCNTLMGHEVFIKDMDLRETQLKLLHKLNQMDKLQEVCEKIVCHDGVKLVLRLEQKESNQALSVRLIQIFLVQDWIKPEQKCCTQELLKLWIRHQYIADHNKEKFLDSVWAIAKVSLSTQQILLLVSGLQRECGNEMIQLYTDLCVYAINVDKGCCEQQMLQGNMEGVKERQQAIAQTCRKLSALYNGLNPKISRISSLTAFSLDASLVNLCLVERMFNRKYCTHSKKECAACIKVFSSVTHCVGDVKVNPATLYEVERLLNMLRPYYLNPDLAWKELLPVCQKFMKERSQSAVETKEETTPPKTPAKKKESKPRPKKSTAKKEMNISPGNIKYYCDDNVSYLPKESVPKMKNKNFRLKSAASSNSCTQTPKLEETKAKQPAVKAATTPSKSSAVFEFDKQLFQYNFKGKPTDQCAPVPASSTVTKEQMSPAGSELPNSLVNNLPKTPTQIANVKCQAVGVDSQGKPVLVKLPVSATTTLSSTVSSMIAPGAARQQTMYVGDTTALGLQPSVGLHVPGQGKVQKSKKRQPHSIGELLEATKVMPCSTSSNFNTAATVMTTPKPATQQSLPTSADLLRAARDYNLTIVQKPTTPKPFQTQYSTADLLRATKNIPQKSKPDVPPASNLKNAKEMVQATKAAFAASVLGFIPKPQSAILSEVSQGLPKTLDHLGSLGGLGSERKPTKKPKAPRKPKTVHSVPGQIHPKANVNELNVSQCNSVQPTSNRTVIAHSYKTVDGSISFLSSNVVGGSNIIPSIVNPVNTQSVSSVRPPAKSFQANDKSNHRPRIIPVRATCNTKYPPYCSTVVAVTSATPSPGHVVGANTVVTTSTNPSSQTHIEQEIYNMFTKEKPAVKQTAAASKIEGFRRPSADELQSIVDWLQTGTEDDKKKSQIKPPVSTMSTQQVVTSVPSTVQSTTLPSMVTPNVTTASSMVMSPAGASPKAVSLSHEQLQKIMAGLNQRQQKIKQKPNPTNKMQQKKSLNKQLQQLIAQDINKGNKRSTGSENHFAQQNPSQISVCGDQTVQPSSTHIGQLFQPLTTNGSQLVQASVTHVSQLVQQSTTHGNQLVQPLTSNISQQVQQSTAHVGQLFQPLTTHVSQLVQPSATQVIQLVQQSTSNEGLVQPISQFQKQPPFSQGVGLENLQIQPSLTQENQPLHPSSSLGNQPIKPSSSLGNPPLHPSSSLGNQPLHSSSSLGNQPLQPSSSLGNQPLHSSSSLGNQPLQPSSSLGNQPLQPSSSLGNQPLQPSSSLGNQPLHSSSSLGNQPLHSSSSLGNQPLQPSSSLGNQPLHSSSSLGNQPLQPSSSLGNQPLQPSSSLGKQPLHPSSSLGNHSIQLSSTSLANQPALGQASQVTQLPLTHGNQETRPLSTVSNQPIQQSQNQGVVSGNPLQQVQTQGIYTGNKLALTSQQTSVSDSFMTLNSTSVKPQLIAPAMTLPVSSQGTINQSLLSIDQLTNAMQTTSTPGIQSSLSFPSQFQISGSKSLTLSPNQPTSRMFELQYLGQINPPSKILHPKPPSKDGPLAPSTAAPGDPVGKSSELSLETNAKTFSEIQGLMRSKQPTFIPKTLSSEDEVNIPKMPLGTLKVVEKPDLISTLNRSPSKLSIDHNHSAAAGSSVTTFLGNQQHTSAVTAVSSSSDHGVSLNTWQSETSSSQTDILTTSEGSYPHSNGSDQTTTCSSMGQVESTFNETLRSVGTVKEVSETLDIQTTYNTDSNLVVDSKAVGLTRTSESTISSSSEIDKEVNDSGATVLTPDTRDPVNSEENALENRCEDSDKSVKESETSEIADSSTSPDSTALTMNSAGDANSDSTSVNNKYNSSDGNDNCTTVQSEANCTKESHVLDPIPDTKLPCTSDDVLLTPKGHLAGEITPMMEESVGQTTSRLSEKEELEATSGSSSDCKPTERSDSSPTEQVETINTKSSLLLPDTMEEGSSVNDKEYVEEDQNVSDLTKATGSDSNTSEKLQPVDQEMDEETNFMNNSSHITTPSIEHIEKKSISETTTNADDKLTVPTCVPDYTALNVGNSISIVTDVKEENEVSNIEQNCVQSDEDTDNAKASNGFELDKALALDDALGESAALLSSPLVQFAVEPSQQLVEDNSTTELRNSPDVGHPSSEDAQRAQPVISMLPTPELRNSVLRDVRHPSSEESDANAERAHPVISMLPTQELTFGSNLDIKDDQVTEKISVQTIPHSQGIFQTKKSPEQDKEASLDPSNIKLVLEDMGAENKQYLSNDNPDSPEKDSLPNKDWENAFVSFIDHLGEKKTVKTDNNKVSSKPIFSRQDSSGSESSSRSVGSSLGSRGSYKSTLDEDSSGTRILPLQRRDNDVKRFEYFNHLTPSHKSNKRRSSNKGLSGLQIQALPEIKSKSKKLVLTSELTEVTQQKEVVNKCIICSKIFRSVDSLKCHVRNICRPMDTSRPEANLKDFEYKTVYSCRKCEKEVSNKDEIKAHVAECCRDDDVIQALSFSTKYMCQMCGEYFTNKDDVHSHVSRLCSKVMSCRQQQQERLDRKAELTAKPLSDMVESWFGKGQKHTENNIKEEVQEETPETDEKQNSLGVDDLEAEIFSEANNQAGVDIKEESEAKPPKECKHQHSIRSLLPAKQWSLRNKTKFSSRLKGFEFFSNKLNPARRRTEQRKWHEDYHSLRNRVVKKEAVNHAEDDKEENSAEHDGKTYAKHKKNPRTAASADSSVQKEQCTDDTDMETKDNKDMDLDKVTSSKSVSVKSEKKESNNTEIQNHVAAKSKGTDKDMANLTTMDPPIRQKRVIQVGRKFLEDEFEVPEFLKIQVASTNLKRKSPQHCPKCGQFFSSSYVLIQHIVRVHMSPCRSKWNSSARKFQFACWYCSDAFPTYIKLSKHVPVHKDKILAMLKKSCSTSRRLRKEGANLNNANTKVEKSSISKTRRSAKAESLSIHKSVMKKELSPTKETEADALSQHVESMRSSRRARGQPPLAVDVSELKVDTVKKERSRSREKDATSVGGMISPSDSLSPGTLDMRTTRSRRRDNDSMSTSSFDHDDDLASNCSHATDKSSQSKGKREYNKRGLSEDRESMTSEDSLCHRPVTRHQLAAQISPTLKDGPCTAKKLKRPSGDGAESELGQRSRTRSGNILSKTASQKSSTMVQGTSDKNSACTKPASKMASSVRKGEPNKASGSPVTRNQSKVDSDSTKNLNDSVSQMRRTRKDARTNEERKTSAKGLEVSSKDDNNPASNMTTRRSRRLNTLLENVKEENTEDDNSIKTSAVVKLHRANLTRHKNSEDYKSSGSTHNNKEINKRKMFTKSKLEEKERELKKIKLSASDRNDDGSKKCTEQEDEGNTETSLHKDTVDKKSVLVIGEEDEEFVYVKSPLPSPTGETTEKVPENSSTLSNKTAFLESFKKYIHKPAPRWTNSFHLRSVVTKSKFKQKVCRAQAKLFQKRKRENMRSSRFSSEDEADDELDEDVHNLNVSKNSNKKKSFLDSFIAHCDHGPSLKGFYSEDLSVIVPKENSTKKSKSEALPKGKKTADNKKKSLGQASQPHQVKKDVITKSEKIIANTEMSLSV